MTLMGRFGVGRALYNNMNLLLLLFCSFLLNFTGCEAVGYFGQKIGPLLELNHGVKGVVYAVDSRTIHLKDFSYDGHAPDAFFYTGTSGSTPHEKGIIIPDENGGMLPLGAYNKKDVTLTLPDGLTLKDVPWIAVWCREYAVNFGHVVVPKNFDYPRPQKIDALPTFDHGVSSDKIVVVDAQTFLIPNFYYDGTAPDAFFWAGTGKPDTNGVRVPDENGALEPLKKYSGKTIVITLPNDLTVFDIDYLGVWCRAFYVDFSHVILPKNLNVPPSLKMLGVAPQNLPGYPNLSPSLSSLINDIGSKPLSQHPPPILHQPDIPHLLNKFNQQSPGPLPLPPPPPPHPPSSHPFFSPQSLFVNQGAQQQIFPPPQSPLFSQQHVNKPVQPLQFPQSHLHNLGGRPLSPSSLPHSTSFGSHRVPLSHTFNQPTLYHPSQNQIVFPQLQQQSLPPASPLGRPLFHKSELKFSFKEKPTKASAMFLPNGINPVSFSSPSGHAIQRPVFSPPRSNIVPTQIGSAPSVFPNHLTNSQRVNQHFGVTQNGVPIYFPAYGNPHLQQIPYSNQINSHSSDQASGINFSLHDSLVPQSHKHTSPGHINSIPNGGGQLVDFKFSQKNVNTQINLQNPSINHLNHFPQITSAFRQRFPAIGGPRHQLPIRPISGQTVNSPVNFIPDHFRIQSNIGPVRRNFEVEPGTLEGRVSFENYDNINPRSRVKRRLELFSDDKTNDQISNKE